MRSYFYKTILSYESLKTNIATLQNVFCDVVMHVLKKKILLMLSATFIHISKAKILKFLYFVLFSFKQNYTC